MTNIVEMILLKIHTKNQLIKLNQYFNNYNSELSTSY